MALRARLAGLVCRLRNHPQRQPPGDAAKDNTAHRLPHQHTLRTV
jgi:hypothetical protein